MNDLISLCYVSRSLIGDDPARIVEIWEVAAQNNERLGLTGALYFDEDIFFQVLEGEESVVQSTYEKIKADPRHKDSVILSEYFCATRSLGFWSMKVISKFADKHRQSMFTWDALRAASPNEINRRIRSLISA